MTNWLKSNILNIIILIALFFVIIQVANLKSELELVKELSQKTARETELNNSKLDYVESDINSNRIQDSVHNRKK
ncbi:MAG: hypothetical protein EAZ27_10570 [Cytophagales bacterium]|nr:MAG: hypothetical protein EAZ27_10570 [Cytophagales bacterium]